MLVLILLYAALITAAGFISLLLKNGKKAAEYAVPAVSAASSLVLLLLIVKGFSNFSDQSFVLSWQLPYAEFKTGLDYISLFFMIPLLILTAACSLYGSQYFRGKAGKLHWFSFSLLAAGMVMVLLSRNGILFLISWEIMSFSSFLLVITDYEKEDVRKAGWIYFITAHVGTAFLFTSFLLLSSGSGIFDFEMFGKMHFSVSKSNLIFISALIGFGMKAGFIPFHIWLPLAHPAAPSHVSALMSGIMIKMGIYGIIRILLILGQFQGWWGILLIVLGSVSGILGILFASGQHDIKKLLAFSSVENIGIILLGLGMGITGRAYNYPAVSVFAFAGAFLHIFNHSIFKALLFLGAGAVIRQTGTGEIDRLGGLLKKLPWTGSLFLAGSIAITGLPFFNGFISEILIYISSITGSVKGEGSLLPLVSAVTVISLASIGGLASLCFTKVFGTVFQGMPRDSSIKNISEVPFLMKGSMVFLSIFTVFIGMTSFIVLPFIEKPAALIAGNITGKYFEILKTGMTTVSLVLASSLIIILMLLYFRLSNSGKRPLKAGDTWGCGYLFPTSRMQYTASSYADPALDKFRGLTAGRKYKDFTEELFPGKNWSFRSEVEDWFLSRVFIKAVKLIDALLALLRWFQCGKAGVYVIYAAFTVVILIVWKFVL